MQPIDRSKEEIIDMLNAAPAFEDSESCSAYIRNLISKCIEVTKAYATFPSKEANNAWTYNADTTVHIGHRCNYHTNNLDVAIEFCRDVMNYLRKYESRMNVYEYSYGKALISSRLADLYFETGDIIESENLYHEALDLYQSAWDSGVLDSYECNIVVTIGGLSEIYYSTLERDKEEEVFREGETLLRCLTERNDLYWEDLGIINSMLMDLAKENRKPSDVEMYFHQIVEIYSTLLSDEKYRNESFYKDYYSYEDIYQCEARYQDVSIHSYIRKKQLFTSLCSRM